MNINPKVAKNLLKNGSSDKADKASEKLQLNKNIFYLLQKMDLEKEHHFMIIELQIEAEKEL